MNKSLLMHLPEDCIAYDPNELFKEDNDRFDEVFKDYDLLDINKKHLKNIINKIWIRPSDDIESLIRNYIKDNNCNFDIILMDDAKLLEDNKLVIGIKEFKSDTIYKIIIN